MHWTEKLAKLVEERGFSYREVEQRAGWAPNTLKAAISRHANPSIAKAITLARSFNVAVDWLFDDSAPWENREEQDVAGLERDLAVALLELLQNFDSILLAIDQGKVTAKALFTRMFEITLNCGGIRHVNRTRLWACVHAVYFAFRASTDPDSPVSVPTKVPTTGITWQSAFASAVESIVSGQTGNYPIVFPVTVP